MRIIVMTLCLATIFCNRLIAQYPTEGQEVITNRNNLPKGWVIIGASGTGLDVKYSIIDGGRYDTGQQISVCYLDNVEYSSDWERVAYNDYGCGQCSVTPPGGIAKTACWTYKKKTPKTVFSSNKQNLQPNKPGIPNKPQNVPNAKDESDGSGFLHLGLTTMTNTKYKRIEYILNGKFIDCIEIVPDHLYLEINETKVYETSNKSMHWLPEFEDFNTHVSSLPLVVKTGLNDFICHINIIHEGVRKTIQDRTYTVVIEKDKSSRLHFFIDDILKEYIKSYDKLKFTPPNFIPKNNPPNFIPGNK